MNMNQLNQLVELENNYDLNVQLNTQSSSNAQQQNSKQTTQSILWIPYLNQKLGSFLTSPCCPSFFKFRHKLFHLLSCPILSNFTLGEFLFGVILGGGLVVTTLYYSFIYDTSNYLPLKKAIYLSGRLSAIAQILVFSFACRNSIWFVISGIPFERGLFWHKFFVFVLIVNSFSHGWISGKFKWGHYGLSYFVTICSFLVVSFWIFRRKFFEIYYYLHILIVFWLILVSYYHSSSVQYIGYSLWGIDLMVRQVITIANSNKTKEVAIKPMPNKMVELRWAREEFNFIGGQYIFICIPELSLFQWHPFSILSGSNMDDIVLLIKTLGGWTKNLNALAKKQQKIRIFIEGPYGNPDIDFSDPGIKHYLFVAGGVGISPILSICNDLLYQANIQGRVIQKITLVWCNQSEETFKSEILKDVIQFVKNDQNAQSSSENVNRILDLQLYVTRPSTDQVKQIEERNLIDKLIKFEKPKLVDICKSCYQQTIDDGSNKLAIMTCGPTNLMNRLAKLSEKINSKYCRVYFHHEVFEF